MSTTSSGAAEPIEQHIGGWRMHVLESGTVTAAHAADLEGHLREQIRSLSAGGLSAEEAFLVAVKRLSARDASTLEFAREHAERLWKQLVISPGAAAAAAPISGSESRRLWVAIALAVAAAAAIKVPALLGIRFGEDAFYRLNIGLFTLPFIVAYFAWERPLPRSSWLSLAAVFALSAAAVNFYPFSPPGEADTELLAALHLPIALWLAVGVAYVGGRWRGSERRMDFIRFTGELFIYYVLIGLGGGVLIVSTTGLFQAIGVNAGPQVQDWIVPCGIVGASVIATWIVDAKRHVMGNIAPVLTRIFSPLFALMLIAFMVTMLATGRGIDSTRVILIAFDLLLVVVFGLLLYSISARDPQAPPGLFDCIQLTLVAAALAVDALALWAIGGRITELGFTPNRVAALGENVVLLVNLAGSALLYASFLRGRARFERLLSWQTTYLYVLAGWAAVVAFVFPLLFGFR